MVTRFDRGDAGADLADDARAFMPEDRRKDALAVEAVQGVGVGMANAGGLDLDQDFTGFRSFQIELDDFQRFLGLESDGGACLHDPVSLLSRLR